ncbi:MAG TPA: nucleotidyltransferase domain-containing protein [Oligoflexus sp.]|uniref:nucleotidyltransferase domain-containing protein n=1 Tax=Oligoflexus sp. TaxID=1971216 RepID=UPI002D6B85E5|nr:nucleotidyltransferase domain-containing protein [Oligoflexus sp.]HYX38928.1 nucleotidyltransferase domain-containing protein [Oligoflexus sp.]
MRISSKEKIAQMPALEARKILRLFRDNNCHQPVEGIAYRLKIDNNEEALRLLDALTHEGYLDRTHEGYFPTPKGNSLALASANPPIKRARAEKMVAEMLERIQKINTNPDYLWRVALVVVFGSFVRGEELLSDVDVGVRLVRRPGLANEVYGQQSKERVELARKQGKRFGSYIDEIVWPSTEVWNAVKSRTIGLSLHDMDQADEREMILAGTHEVLLGEVDK